MGLRHHVLEIIAQKDHFDINIIRVDFLFILSNTLTDLYLV